MQPIPFMIPDMPTAEELLPWLRQIDENRWYSNFGPLNHQFQQELLEFFDPSYSHVLTVANCTIGLTLALEALNLPKGTLVLMPSFSFVATATAVIDAGLQPIFADLCPKSWLLTPELAEEACQQHKIAAVMPVTTLNAPQDPLRWDRFTEETGIPVIVDAAGAFGNQPHGKIISYVFSLHTTKSLGIGEGGFVVSPSASMIERIRILSNFGMGELPQPRIIKHAGVNAKLSEYHAAVGLANLRRWPEQVKKRIALADRYISKLSALDQIIAFQPGAKDFIRSAMPVRLAPGIDVHQCALRLQQQGIATLRWYYPPLHQHPAFAAYSTVGTLHHTENFAQNLIGLPFHLNLTDACLERIYENCKEIFADSMIGVSQHA